MTKRERILAMLRGEPVDRVPFAINAWQWYYYHRYHGLLPPEYRDCATALDFLKRLGADILTRWDGQIKGRSGLGRHVRFPHCRLTREEIGQPIDRPVETAFNDYTRRDHARVVLETPDGTLTQTWWFNRELVADFEEEYWVKDWERDFPAFRFAALDRSYDFVMEEYQRDLAHLGDDGVIMIEIPENPIKMLYWFMGPEKAMVTLMSRPDAFGEIFERHTTMTLEFIDGVCARTRFDDAPLLISNDNLDVMTMPPYWFDQFLYNHYQRVGERIRAHGRLFAVHSCGRNWLLREQIRKSGIDMLEGLTPPPAGDFPLHLATQEFGEAFIVNGGMAYPVQEVRENARETIDEYGRRFFEEMKDTARLIYASSCQTSTAAPIENLHWLRDGCWRYGRRD